MESTLLTMQIKTQKQKGKGRKKRNIGVFLDRGVMFKVLPNSWLKLTYFRAKGLWLAVRDLTKCANFARTKSCSCIKEHNFQNIHTLTLLLM